MYRIKFAVYFCCSLVLFISFSCQKNHLNEEGNLVPKTADQDTSIPSAFVNGAFLHTVAFGKPEDPLIIVLHGGPGADFKHLLNCKEFAQHGYRVVLYDQRGSGLSQRFSYQSYLRNPMELMYDDLSGIIAHYKRLPTQKVFLLGHSWGAMLASAYVNLYPNTIDGMVLCEPGGLIWQDVADYLKRSQAIKVFSENLNDAAYYEQFMPAKPDEHALMDYRFALLFSSAIAPSNKEASLSVFRGGAVVMKAYLDWGNKNKPDWTTNLQQFTTKVLFVYSALNNAYGLQHAQKVASAYPKVQLFRTDGAGHFMLSSAIGWKNTFPVMLDYFNNLK